MSIKVGDTIPDVNVIHMGEKGPEAVSLKSLVGDKPLVLLSVPFSFTPVCTTELCDMTSRLDTYKKLDAEVVGLSGDSPFAQANWAKQENISLRMLSDYDHEFAKAAGINHADLLGMKGVTKRAAFVFDKEGKCVHAEILENPKEVPSFDDVEKAVKALPS